MVDTTSDARHTTPRSAAPRTTTPTERRLDARTKTLMAVLERVDQAGDAPSRALRAEAKVAFRAFAVAVDAWLREQGEISAEARDAAIAELQERFLPHFIRADGPRRFYEKPRGYAGDAQSIEMIYDNVPSGDGAIGRMLDECFLAQPAAAAVRNRRGLLADQIRTAVERNDGGTTRIASLACGPARELFDVLEHADFADAVEATCVDMDAEALADVAARRRDHHPDAELKLVRENLLSVAFGRRKLPAEPLDLAYSIGLIDYFEDRVVVKLLDAIYDHLAPGGRVILGNFHPDNPDRGIMECFLEWNLIHRSEEDMRALYAQSKFGADSVEIVFEEERVNLFAIATKQA